ncbi:MAG TPA: translation initiation factor IF-2 [Alphaproteobacteria bacterium]|nr:translation initiation factor IF-2 [Alphaproteobacteria bacterium]
MSDNKEQEPKKVLSLSGRGKLELKRPSDSTAQVRQSFSHGRSKAVTVEVKTQRVRAPLTLSPQTEPAAQHDADQAPRRPEAAPAVRAGLQPRQLTAEEREVRNRALMFAAQEEKRRPTEAESEGVTVAEPQTEIDEPAPAPVVEQRVSLDPEARRQRELEEMRQMQEAEKQKADEAERVRLEAETRKKGEEAEKKSTEERQRIADRAGDAAAAKVAGLGGRTTEEDEEEERRARAKRGVRAPAPKVPAPTRSRDGARRTGKLTISQALTNEGDNTRMRSLAAMRRAREKERHRMMGDDDQQKVVRDVVLPETITVQELAQRMAERSGDVIKALMRMGVMATITQSIDADTAELIISEFGHRLRRVAESDVELGLEGEIDAAEDMVPRPPVVTVMGHVDHGKTSLLDAMRQTDVVSGEAGGITQHIGAYQVQLAGGQRITFIDTPGHAAFTEMRSRGAHVTDIVILVVAANDGIMPQTIEAIAHAKAAGVPIIVAINKVDLPDANVAKVRQELLQHELVVEELGGDILAVEVSAKTKQNLDKLEEAILLQAEILELRANPNRTAVGAVIESKLDRGRGAVATILVQKGTLHVGDVFVTGSEIGRVRALVDDRGNSVESAGPAMPIEVLGLNGTPSAGDDFIVVDNEARAREIAEFRDRRKRNAAAAITARGSVEQMFSQIQAGERKELPIVIKGDVHGSVEAIVGSLSKLGEDQNEVGLRVLHSGVGAINESDVTLAKASGGFVAGFNVRANAQARELAKRDGVEIRYYSIIYNILDDVKAMLSGMLSPSVRENFLGNAAIRQIFVVTKSGKVAGCMVTEGVVRRGAKVRLLRDNVVIHEGTLKTLRRFKEEVREVREGFECGMAFENYDNIEVGDVIEAFEVEEVARTIE